MSNLEIEKAVEQVEMSQLEVDRAIESLEASFRETVQKVGLAVSRLKKYPGLVWVVAGAVGARAAIDFFAKRVDSRSSRSYYAPGKFNGIENSDRA